MYLFSHNKPINTLCIGKWLNLKREIIAVLVKL